MKTNILLSLCLFPVFLFGQTVNHFNQSDSRWNVARTHPEANQENPNFVKPTTTVYGIQGDTTINSKQWFKMYSTKDSLFLNNLVYRGLIRSESNRVFYLNYLNQLDTLYDFNLNVGDSVLFNLYGSMPTWHHIISVGNIQINGETYKTQKFDEQGPSAFSDMNEVWIEGIGSMHGPLFPNYPIKFSSEIPDSTLLTCTYSANQDLWQNPFYSDCYINITLGIDAAEIQNFSFYPNPFYDKIHFENLEVENLNLTVLNSLGQVVKKVQLTNSIESIDLSDLNEGFYVFQFSDHKNSRIERLIKKK